MRAIVLDTKVADIACVQLHILRRLEAWKRHGFPFEEEYRCRSCRA